MLRANLFSLGINLSFSIIISQFANFFGLILLALPPTSLIPRRLVMRLTSNIFTMPFWIVHFTDEGLFAIYTTLI